MQWSPCAPDAALTMLREGNTRYANEEIQRPHLSRERRTATSLEGQRPFAAVLSCSDSRVPVELIFDRGIGDIFVVRVAGNVLGSSELASVEYAVHHLGTPLFVVMGHKKCGAIKAVFETGALEGNLRTLSDKILSAVRQAKHDAAQTAEHAQLDEAARINVWNAIGDALASSRIIREKVRDGELMVVGSLYDVHTGQVEWMGQHQAQGRFLASDGA